MEEPNRTVIETPGSRSWRRRFQVQQMSCCRSPVAFREMYRLITGREPKRLDVMSEKEPVLDGMVTGRAGGLPSKLPVARAIVEIFEVSPTTGERQGSAVHSRTTGTDGRWGPFTASPRRLS